MNVKKISAALAGLSLLCGTAFAQPEAVQAPEPPAMIILEIQPVDPSTGEPVAVDEATINMILMQLLAALEAEGGERELPLLAPPVEVAPAAGPGVGI